MREGTPKYWWYPDKRNMEEINPVLHCFPFLWLVSPSTTTAAALVTFQEVEPAPQKKRGAVQGSSQCPAPSLSGQLAGPQPLWGRRQ